MRIPRVLFLPFSLLFLEVEEFLLPGLSVAPSTKVVAHFLKSFTRSGYLPQGIVVVLPIVVSYNELADQPTGTHVLCDGSEDTLLRSATPLSS